MSFPLIGCNAMTIAVALVKRGIDGAKFIDKRYVIARP
jgi:hypothetical protein